MKATTNTNTRLLELQNLTRQRKTVVERFFLAMYPSVFSDVASPHDAKHIWDHALFSQLLTAINTFAKMIELYTARFVIRETGDHSTPHWHLAPLTRKEYEQMFQEMTAQALWNNKYVRKSLI